MPKRLLMPLLAAAALMLAVAPAARAADDGSAEAKAHYQKAMAHYAVGEYKEAAAEYEAAFKAKQDPALLYNAAQSHRLSGDNAKALLLYKNLVKLYPSTKYATEAKDRIEKLEQAIASTQSPPNAPAPVEGGGATTTPPPGGSATAPPPPPPPPGGVATGAPPAVEPPPSAGAGTPAGTLTTAPPPAGGDTGESAPVYKRWWFWAGVGAVVVAGVVTAVALSSGSSEPWSNVPDVHAAAGPGVRW